MLPDIQHATFPIGPIGREVHAALMFPGAIYKYSKYPNAAKEYLRFIMEREQYEPWQRASIGYISHTLRAYDSNPVWTEDPQHMFYRDIAKGARHAGYAGKLGKESAAALADFIVVDMFGRRAPGNRRPRRRPSAPRSAHGATIGSAKNEPPRPRRQRFYQWRKYVSLKEVVELHVLLTRSLFGGGIPRRSLRRVSLAKSTSAPVRF